MGNGLVLLLGSGNGEESYSLIVVPRPWDIKQTKLYMAYLLNVDLGQVIVIADNLSELDRKVKEAGILHYEIESVIDYVIL